MTECCWANLCVDSLNCRAKLSIFRLSSLITKSPPTISSSPTPLFTSFTFGVGVVVDGAVVAVVDVVA